MKKKILIGVAVVVVLVCALFVGIRSANTSRYIKYVKGLVFSNVYDIPIGDVIDDYLGDEHWKYFEASSGEKVVEVSGKMMYDGEKVNARLQFIIEEDGTSLGAFSMNDISQNEFAKAIIINAMHDTYAEEHNIAKLEEVSEETEEEIAEVEETEEMDSDEEVEETEEFDPETYVPDFNNPDGERIEDSTVDTVYFRTVDIINEYTAEVILYYTIDDLYSGCNGTSAWIYIDTTAGLCLDYTGCFKMSDAWMYEINEDDGFITVTSYESVDVSSLYENNSDDYVDEYDFGVEDPDSGWE